ncbi:MAG: hypothetical protein Q8N10_09280 [Phenylobacterium sp.]|uniref:DUF4870 family protein n=1 Tax=Phenylobacterium sp. TaxID=1871053 RepID=UPI002716060C|nr:hypothetical protein [Phenylobacterium sp.]MDO8911958.1 hypothetical protein [Phenylobacterium sp.]MDP2009780.1 hypothetical protein [Phenylobacterium sp.]MDP3100680.1 hypothetical protein [Phenylobacterium sp.]
MSERLNNGTVTATEDKTLPMVAYVLYLLTFATFFTVFIGLLIAYSNRATAGPRMESHYTFMIRTFWLSIWWFIIGGLLVLFGGVFSVILVGIPFLMLGVFICSVVGIWFGVRCIMGLLHLSRGEAYPRPMNWLI